MRVTSPEECLPQFPLHPVLGSHIQQSSGEAPIQDQTRLMLCKDGRGFKEVRRGRRPRVDGECLGDFFGLVSSYFLPEAREVDVYLQGIRV